MRSGGVTARCRARSTPRDSPSRRLTARVRCATPRPPRAARAGGCAPPPPPPGEPLERVGEVVSWRPSEVVARAGVDVDALDPLEHPPAARAVDVLVRREPPPHHARRVVAQLREVVAGEGGGRADDVAANPELGLEREPMRLHDI